MTNTKVSLNFLISQTNIQKFKTICYFFVQLKNSLQFFLPFLNTKVGRDIQVSSLHTGLKKKNQVEVNKPCCILPGGRGLQFVFIYIYTYAQNNSVFEQNTHKKELAKK